MKLDILLKYAMLKIKYKRLKRENNILQRDFDYVFEENKILKQINRKRYVEQAKKMQFLIKRENKLQEIEQLARLPKRDTRKILKVIMEIENGGK